VALEASDHAHFSAEVPSICRKNVYDIDGVYRAHEQVYQEAGHPEWVNEMRVFLRENRDKIAKKYENGSIPGAGASDFVERKARALEFLRGL
jgi:hypothetical protein